MRRMIQVTLTASIIVVSIGATRAQEVKQLQPAISALAKSTKTAIGQPLAFPTSSPEITAVLVTLPAGSPPGKLHKHPYQRIAYVLEGTMGVEQEGGETRQYPAGSILIDAHSDDGDPSFRRMATTHTDRWRPGGVRAPLGEVGHLSVVT